MTQTGVLSIGNTVLDVIGKTPENLPRFGELAAGRGPAAIAIGGNGAIAAAAAATMGARTALASAVGDDAWGMWLADRLEAMGVDISQISVLKGEPTATTLSLVRPDGERALLTHNGASDLHDISKIDTSSLGDGSWLLVGSLFLVRRYSGDGLRQLSEAAKGRGARVAMDLSWDHTGEWDVKRLPVDVADILIGNDLELKAATCTTDLDAAIDKMLDMGVGTLVAKLGPQGARIAESASGRRVDVPAPSVVPINATGTGDVFNAGLLVGLSRGLDLEAAVRLACAAGALRVEGGCLTFPSIEDAEALLERPR